MSSANVISSTVNLTGTVQLLTTQCNGCLSVTSTLVYTHKYTYGYTFFKFGQETIFYFKKFKKLFKIIFGGINERG